MSFRKENIIPAVHRCIAANLQDPTHEMRVAFQRLSKAHKVLLFALIDVDSNSVLTQKHDLTVLATALSANEDDLDLDTLLRELSEGFLRINNLKVGGKRTYQQIQWIHPSCRDLAIEELGRSRQFRQRFLRTCSVSGVEMAISVGGGASGQRVLPLLRDAEDWQQLVSRCVELVPKNADLLSIFVSTIEILQQADAEHPSIGPLKDAAASTLHAYASGREYWQAKNLESFLELRRLLVVAQPVPSLRSYFEDECNSLADDLENEQTNVTQSATHLSGFAKVCFVLAQYAPDEAKFVFDSDSFRRFALALEKRAALEVEYDYIRSDWSADDLTDESQYYVELAEACRTFASIKIGKTHPFEAVNDYAWQFESEAERLGEAAARKNPEPDYEQDSESEQETPVNSTQEELQRIFDDL